MRPLRPSALALCGLAFSFAIAGLPLAAQAVDPGLYAQLRWRMIGPFRGGRTVAAVGVPQQPNVFYIGANNGGVWKTNDAGRTWKPIFDGQPTQSIGAIAVAPSDPRVIYVGSGEGLQRPDLSVGDGIYKSTDGGATWRHLGLADGQQIPVVRVDPRDPERVYAAVLGHPYGPNAERGVFRSTDGGAHWEKVLYRDENTGAADLALDPADPRTLYADLWAARQAPWEIGASFQAAGSGLYKSTDGGTTWKPLSGGSSGGSSGLPTFEQGLGRIGIAVAPSRRERLYAQVDADPAHGGLYRSDDAGATWRRVNRETRIWGRGGDFAEVAVDPENPDVVYVCNTSTYRSTDGGATFTAIKGAPGGDDYHRLWIDPANPKTLLLGSDQGATLSVNGGETWSSWYNQPTAQIYHVSADDRFPYWVYGGQQESGSAGVASRGNDGAVTYRDWRPVGAEEYGYVVADPLHPSWIFGGKLQRFDWATGQVQDVSPEPVRSGDVRYVRTLPVVFSPADPHVLYFGASVLFRTTDGGRSWQRASPDLTREKPGVPPVLGVFAAGDPEHGAHRGVIYAVAPSPKDKDLIWAGTDDGLIHLTRDGGAHWKDVTPPDLTPWSKVSILEAGRFDAGTAYAAVNRFRLDDLRPHVYRTHDFGATWREVVRGIPANEVVNAVREDPQRRGLLYAVTERGVYVSWNDGDDWQSLRLNLPPTSVRDLVVHGDDLVVGTHGRGFWILDDMAPLRQLDAEIAAAPAHLFHPPTAYRLRRDLYTDTPPPPEEPAGQNPPDGAILDFKLAAASGPVVLEIRDAAGSLVRRYASDDRPPPVDPTSLAIPTYWIRPPQTLSAEPGAHRFLWDLRYPPPDALDHDYPIGAIVHDTPAEPLGPFALPGDYQVKLTVAGRTLTQPLTVKMDPRVATPPEALAEQLTLARAIVDAMARNAAALREVKALRDRLAKLPKKSKEVEALDTKLAALAEGGGEKGTARAKATDLTKLNGDLARLYDIVEGTDAAPTSQAHAAWTELEKSLAALLARWKEIESQEVPAIHG